MMVVEEHQELLGELVPLQELVDNEVVDDESCSSHEPCTDPRAPCRVLAANVLEEMMQVLVDVSSAAGVLVVTEAIQLVQEEEDQVEEVLEDHKNHEQQEEEEEVCCNGTCHKYGQLWCCNLHDTRAEEEL